MKNFFDSLAYICLGAIGGQLLLGDSWAAFILGVGVLVGLIRVSVERRPRQ